MRCLLNENLPHKLRRGLSEFDPVTVQYAGFSGLKNGELLKASEEAEFDVLVTGDKTLEYEQSMKDRGIAVVSVSAPHWQFVKDHVASIADAIRGPSPGRSRELMSVDSCGTRKPGLQQADSAKSQFRVQLVVPLSGSFPGNAAGFSWTLSL
jgi:hypothetical protein